MNTAERQFVHHYAVTLRETLPRSEKLRSHAWLKERGLPSGMDEVTIVEGVGIAVIPRRAVDKERAAAIQRAMENAVLECYDEDKTDPDYVKGHMRFRASQVKDG